MKKLLTFIASLSIILPLSCRREELIPDALPDTPARECVLASVSVSFAGEPEREDGTKSVVSTEVEGFVDAYLFAFWADTKAVCMAKKGSANRPVAIYTRSKSFEWAVPVGNEQRIDILAVVNPGASERETLDGLLSSETAFNESVLTSLNFTCASSDELRALETGGTHMPMSALSAGIYLEDTSSVLTLKLRRLFSRYDIKIDASRFADSGWTVEAAAIRSTTANTSAPYFYTGGGIGFRQSDLSLLKTVDYATDEDLEKVNTLGDDSRSTSFTTFYFLENCQGDIVGDLCTHLDFVVQARKNGYGSRVFGYRLYLGRGDMKSNFDVVRNSRKRVNYTLDSPTDGFFLDKLSSRVETGKTITFPFETSLTSDELHFTIEKDGASVEIITLAEDFRLNANLTKTKGSGEGERKTDYPHCGTVTLSVPVTAAEGLYTLRGQDKAGEIADEASFEVVNPLYEGFPMGRLPLTGALGFPATSEQGTLLMNDCYKCVPLPGADGNPYLWSHMAEYGGYQSYIEDAFRCLYDVKLEFVSASEGAYDPNVRLWWFAQSDQPYFYYGADSKGSPSSILPAHCIVKIHALEDPDSDHWVTWFEFENLVRYEYGYDLDVEHNGVDCWRGSVNLRFWSVTTSMKPKMPTETYKQMVSSIVDLHPMTLVKRQAIAHEPAGTGTATVDYGIYGTAVTTIDGDIGNPIYTDIFQGSPVSGTVGSTGESYAFPTNYVPYYRAYNAPWCKVGIDGPSMAAVRGWSSELLGQQNADILRENDLYLLPSYYLTYTYGGYSEDGCQLDYYPGILLRAHPSAAWEVNYDESVTSYSTSYYALEVYPDATYQTGTISLILNGFRYPRTYLPGFGLRIMTIDSGDYSFVPPVSFDGNSKLVTVGGSSIPIEDFVSSITFRIGNKVITVNPTAATQTRRFTWNDWKSSGADGAYKYYCVYVNEDREDTREPLPMQGWDFPEKVNWSDVTSVSVTLTDRFRYERDGQMEPFFVRARMVLPAEGGYD